MKKSLILVAEDDVDDRFLLQTAFRESGDHETLEFVENGMDLMEYLNSIVAKGDDTAFPELIILDLNMPKKNGKEVLAELKQSAAFRKIPVIIYTTTKNEIEVQKCYELGANTYIVKPITFEALREVVASIRSSWLSAATMPTHQ